MPVPCQEMSGALQESACICQEPCNGGDGSPFGDGLRCAGGALIRLQVLSSDGTGTSSTSIAIGAKGGVVFGETRRYQCWYRDTSGNQPCGVGVNDFNLSNGYEIFWLP